jgi:diguanylate cyclase (GGDEF)-like protein
MLPDRMAMQRAAGGKHERCAVPEEAVLAPRERDPREKDRPAAASPVPGSYAWLSSDATPPARVLVVEDSPSQADWLKETLAHQGYRISVARDGREALRQVMSDAPDLVVLDVMLPDMDGLEVLRVIKMRSREQFVPVILISAKATLESRVAGLRIGADDFLAKPFAEAEIQARAAAMLRIKSLQDQLREANAQLEKLAVADGLTGLYNRRTFDERLRDEFTRCRRYGDPVSLLILDLDHFKRLNDEYGHPFGDRVLRETAELLSSMLRAPDVCARYGGEEFAVILPKTHMKGALAVGERILARLREKTYAAPGTPSVAAAVRVTASAGVASHPSAGITTPELLVDCADEALYRAKCDGRDRIRVHVARGDAEGDAGPGRSS